MQPTTICLKAEKRFSYLLGAGDKSSVTASSDTFYTKNSVSQTHRPLNIYFCCRRTVDEVDDAIKVVYLTVISSQAEKLLVSNPNQCMHNKVTGLCGNIRGSLTECRCEALDRIQYPSRRRIFENNVISTVLSIIGAAKIGFKMRIAIFACGGLHGEEVLLMRLLAVLKSKGCKGVIHVSLIDSIYEDSIKTSHTVFCPTKPEFLWNELIGNRPDLKQFLQELSLCMPSTIVLEGCVFGSADDYMLKAQLFPQYKHDLLIGADIENTMALMNTINQKACKTDLPAIVLIKDAESNQTVPKLCTIAPNNKVKCVKV